MRDKINEQKAKDIVRSAVIAKREIENKAHQRYDLEDGTQYDGLTDRQKIESLVNLGVKPLEADGILDAIEVIDTTFEKNIKGERSSKNKGSATIDTVSAITSFINSPNNKNIENNFNLLASKFLKAHAREV